MTGAMYENLVFLMIVVVVICTLLFLYFRLTRRHTRIKMALQTSAAMEQQLRDEQHEWHRERQKITDQMKALTTELANAQQDLIIIKQQNDQQSIRLREKNHQLTEQAKQLDNEVERLQEEKNAIETHLRQAKDRWKHQRQQLEHELAQLQERVLSLEGMPPASAVLPEQLQPLQEQCRSLETELERVRGENDNLQAKIETQNQWSAQIQQALEEEVAQLTEKLEEARHAVAK
jgi:DNA repair exonuclease SbcCD ATPase subunit